MKLVSLILTTFNCKDNLIKNLSSIEHQSYENIEVVIKDGLSTDGTVDVIKEYAHNSKHSVIWESSSDSGIYDAMNQGYALSSGDYILFINDLLLKDTSIDLMVKAIEEDDSCVGCHADLVYESDGKIIRYWKMGKQKSFYTGWMPGHPTLMYKREVYEKYGLYDDSYKISADYDLMVRTLKNNRIAYVPEVLVSMYYGGTSTSSYGGYFYGLKEVNASLKKNGFYFIILIDILRTTRLFTQFIRAKFYKNFSLY